MLIAAHPSYAHLPASEAQLPYALRTPETPGSLLDAEVYATGWVSQTVLARLAVRSASNYYPHSLTRLAWQVKRAQCSRRSTTVNVYRGPLADPALW